MRLAKYKIDIYNQLYLIPIGKVELFEEINEQLSQLIDIDALEEVLEETQDILKTSFSEYKTEDIFKHLVIIKDD